MAASAGHNNLETLVISKVSKYTNERKYEPLQEAIRLIEDFHEIIDNLPVNSTKKLEYEHTLRPTVSQDGNRAYIKITGHHIVLQKFLEKAKEKGWKQPRSVVISDTVNVADLANTGAIGPSTRRSHSNRTIRNKGAPRFTGAITYEAAVRGFRPENFAREVSRYKATRRAERKEKPVKNQKEAHKIAKNLEATKNNSNENED